MGACSSVEVVDHDLPSPSKSLPPALSAAIGSAQPTDALTPLPTTTEGSPVAPSLLAALTAVANRTSLSTSTTASASQHASNRNSTSVSKAGAQPTLRLASLTLDHDDDSSAGNDTTSAANSRRSTGEGKTEQAKVAPMAAAVVAYKSNVSPKHAGHDGVRRGGGLLSGSRQERVAAEEREQTAWQDKQAKVEEEKTQDDDGETKRASGRSRFSLMKSKPKAQSPFTPLKPLTRKSVVEPLTPLTPPSVVINYSTVERTAAVDVKGGFGMKKSASADGGFTLPAAPAIATQRISSEVVILDVIRQLGRAQSVSVNTLSQYTRCVPAVLSGPLNRTPRGSGGVSGGLPCCAKLQCTQCGMDVMMLDHHRWLTDVSTDTFRSSYPEVARLRSSLVAAVGSRAYCCACSWVDVKDQVVVDDRLCVGGGDCETKQNIRWVCAGHQ